MSLNPLRKIIPSSYGAPQDSSEATSTEQGPSVCCKKSCESVALERCIMGDMMWFCVNISALGVKLRWLGIDLSENVSESSFLRPRGDSGFEGLLTGLAGVLGTVFCGASGSLDTDSEANIS
ncbi:hypothetical protein OGATHE_006215 [Ogataea polymorpha]|uniref:Uncharacterized protein n=1 Tax=Ogataea polymorpha TaxID=460523 RepID=A0A9P8SZA4_9ASCO|nr:hypothetical protein OGATHE_006215 [Ogataea polymorpha]